MCSPLSPRVVACLGLDSNGYLDCLRKTPPEYPVLIGLSQVLLLRWTKGLDFNAGFQFLEIFSGAGHVTKAWSGSYYEESVSCMGCGLDGHLRHAAGCKTASFDILYGTEMDFLKNGGMAPLADNCYILS